MAAAMGIGRFVYTPILPLMHDDAGLSRQMGANVATANYVGYLVGALITIVVPQVTRSRWALRGGLLVMAASLALMPVSHSVNLWMTCRYVAGLCSGIVFINCAGAVLSGLRAQGHSLVGWAFGGIGVGIAASGAMVLVVREAGTWEEAWLCAAVLVLLGAVASWTMPMAAAPGKAATADGGTAARRAFLALAVSYCVEGVGYIIAGTFLVAAINQNSPGWVGTGAWVLVGVAAIPSAVLWAWLAHHWSRPTLMLSALLLQVVGVLLPVFFDGAAAALLCAAFFGATFLGIAMMALAIGNHLGVPGAVAILTLGYSVGQMLGPLVVTPLLDGGYRPALAVSAGIVGASALAAAVLRVGFPHHLGALPRSLQRS
jgi:predicted MFS family arabinose efflux permease